MIRVKKLGGQRFIEKDLLVEKREYLIPTQSPQSSPSWASLGDFVSSHYKLLVSHAAGV
jgi:hypothetical protein